MAAKNYWDKTFVIGLNKWPKRELDEQEIRRISFSYERMFAPNLAKARIPSPIEVISKCEGFVVNHGIVRDPNQKVKQPDGRTRRTQLMSAILIGNLADVQKLIDGGADPNEFIPESGEGPLAYAMRRALERKDPSIMDYLLGLNLDRETVNLPASTGRETPLQFAIEMANVTAVRRLIELGADVGQACAGRVSPLCYALSIFYQQLRPDETRSDLAYAIGESPAEAADAKRGFVLDVDLASSRLPLYMLAQTSEEKRQMFDAVKDHYNYPLKDRRLVIGALLDGGADPNLRYRNEPHRLEKWTPTLFAAQIGDFEVFKSIVEHDGQLRGNPNLSLKPTSAIERYDAMWVALLYNRQVIVSYLHQQRSIPD